MSNAGTVFMKCCICGHKWSEPLTAVQPMCPKCYGPGVVEKVEARKRK